MTLTCKRVVALVLAAGMALLAASAAAEPLQRLARPAAAMEARYTFLLSHDLLWSAALSAERELWQPLAATLNRTQETLVGQLSTAANLRFSAFRFKDPALSAAFFDLQTRPGRLAATLHPGQ